MKRYALLDTDFISKTHSVQDDGGNHLIDRVMELPEYEFFCHAQIVTELNRYNADVNKLGFAIVRENFRKERNDWKLDLRVGEGADAIELEIFAEPNPPKRVNRPEACGLRHLAFRVEDVEATVAELEQMGIGCEPIRLDSYTQKKMTFFFDPDGLPLELHE